jgi:hypothetical protein
MERIRMKRRIIMKRHGARFALIQITQTEALVFYLFTIFLSVIETIIQFNQTEALVFYLFTIFLSMISKEYKPIEFKLIHDM